MKQMYGVREPKSQVLRDLLQNALRGDIALLQRSRQILRLAARRSIQHSSQRTEPVGLFDFANSGIHRPTRTPRFQRCAVTIEADVPDLGFARGRAVKNAAVHHQTATQAAAEGHIEY